MSALIDVNKLKFTVFGRGYDDERGNSGSGAKEPDSLGMDSQMACFSDDGRYCWQVIYNGQYQLYKYDTTTWQTVDQGTIPHVDNVYHPRNVVDNNLGICCTGYGGTVYVFDLTSNEVLTTLTLPRYVGFGGIIACAYDEDNDKIYLATMNKQRASKYIYTLDLANNSVSYFAYANIMLNGFINESMMYCKRIAEWFSQWDYAFALTPSSSEVWGLSPTDEQTHSFPKISYVTWGLVGNGKLYLPSLIGDHWVMGVYDGTTTPDLITPTPIDTYGRFSSRPDIGVNIAYTNGTTKGCFNCGDGTFVIDFANKELTLISEAQEEILGMSDSLIMCKGGKVFYY